MIFVLSHKMHDDLAGVLTMDDKQLLFEGIGNHPWFMKSEQPVLGELDQ